MTDDNDDNKPRGGKPGGNDRPRKPFVKKRFDRSGDGGGARKGGFSAKKPGGRPIQRDDGTQEGRPERVSRAPRFDRSGRDGGVRKETGERPARVDRGDKPRFEGKPREGGFRKEGGERPARFDRGDKPRVDSKPRFEGKPREAGFRKEGGERPARFDRGDKPRFEGKPREGGFRKEGGEGPARFDRGDKPRFDSKPRFEGKPREGGFRKEGGERPARFDRGDKPRFEGKPREGVVRKEGGFRPARFDRGDKPRFDNKPRFEGKPREGGFRKEGGERPARFDRGDKPRFDSKPRFEGKPREGGFRKEGGERPAKFDRGDKPRFDSKPRFEGKPREGGFRKEGYKRPERSGDRPDFRRGPEGERGPPPKREGGGESRSFQRSEKRADFQRAGERAQRDERSSAAPESSGTSGAAGAERIARVMARAGLCSRREAEEWILAGRVSVNGEVIASPALDVTPRDYILVDGARLPERERTRLWLYHKPRGLVTTADDPEGRATVFANLPEGLPRVVSIGRLDINSEGLLLLTNDGGLSRVLGHPSTGWLRRYRVRAHGEITQDRLDTLKNGITIDEIEYEPINARLDRIQGGNVWLTMDLTEGKNREVKRVLEHFGLSVSRLIRVSFGPLQLGDLAEGAVYEVPTRMLQDQLGPRLSEEAEANFDAPVRTTPEAAFARPKRYVKRDEFQTRRREASLGESPDFKVERGATEDRKGRKVKVERIVGSDRPRAPRAKAPGGSDTPRRKPPKASE